MIKYNFGDNVVIFQADTLLSPGDINNMKNLIEEGFKTGYIVLDVTWKITVLPKK